MSRVASHALPENGEEMITFRLGKDGALSESRKDGQHWEHGVDRSEWPAYIQTIAEYMAKCTAQEGRPNTTPWFWIVRVEDLKQACRIMD